jgi:two-component system sensor histidine kinase QseC
MRSIRNRITLALGIAGAFLLVTLAVATYLGARMLLREQFDDGLRARLQALTSLLHWKPGTVKLDYKGEFMPEFEKPAGEFFFQVWTENQAQPLERSHSLGGSDLPRFGGPAAAPEFRDVVLPDGRPARATGISLRRTDGHVLNLPELMRAPAGPGADVVVAGDTRALQRRLRRLAIEVVLGGSISLAALAFLVRRILRHELRLLDALSQRASQLDANSLTQRFPEADLPAELRPIATRLNDLLMRLEHAFQRERRFSANVAHELRTPIAELLTLAEVGDRLSGKPAESSEFFKDVAQISRKMNGTVAMLLLLAKCENGRQPIQRTTLALRQFVEGLCQEAAVQAKARGLSLHCAADAEVTTDPTLLEPLCRILFENALEYTASGGSVTVCTRAHELVVSNGPVALEPADLTHLFERFWRKDDARSESGHSGLGLAVAAELARVLGHQLVPSLDATRMFHMRVVFCPCGQPHLDSKR